VYYHGNERVAICTTLGLDLMICAQISKYNYLRNDCAKDLSKKRFWHNRLQCKSYQRPASAAAAPLHPFAFIQNRSRAAVGLEAVVSPAPGYAAFSLVSTCTSSPARANKLMSLSILNRLISPLSRLLIRGWVSPKNVAASACVQPCS